jgi:hypothetical protein
MTYNRSGETYADISPAHARILRSIKFVVLPMDHILKVHDARVVVVLTRKDDFVKIARMRVRDGMLISVLIAS